MNMPVDNTREMLKTQFNISWSLLEYHLENLGDEECLWKPCPKGINVEKVEKKSGEWSVDWPESEGYDIGPPNIAWLIWHITFWWSMVFDHSFGGKTLRREEIVWLGTVTDAKNNVFRLRQNWVDKLDSLTDEDLVSVKFTKWPFEDKPFYDLAGWLNLELMKNASEIGYCRFMYANRIK